MEGEMSEGGLRRVVDSWGRRGRRRHGGGAESGAHLRRGADESHDPDVPPGPPNPSPVEWDGSVNSPYRLGLTRTDRHWPGRADRQLDRHTIRDEAGTHAHARTEAP